MPGPVRTPTPILRARGSWLAKTREGEVEYDAGLPACPAWLTKEGKRAWKRVADQLLRAGVGQRADADLLAAYCEAVGEVERLTKAVGKKGDDWRLLLSRRQAVETMVKLGKEFGFTPASRSRVQVNNGGEDDEDRNGKPFPSL